MKYLYKIHSGYDGFFPARLPERMLNGKTLRLRWKRYLDAVEDGDEIWVYFHGPHRFDNGVYARGVVERIDLEDKDVYLRVVEHDSARALTDAESSAQIAGVVATRYQQVFVLPEDLEEQPVCSMGTTAASCRAHRCGSCPVWRRTPTVNRAILTTPHRLQGHVDRYAPAYWVVPNRSFLYRAGRPVRPGVVRSSEMFYRFKTGEGSLAFPLALALHRALAKAHRLDFDAIVPVPLSPDKAKLGELHRTLVLSRELGRLLGSPVRQWLTLSGPISKRKLRTGGGLSAAAFEDRYSAAVTASPKFRTAQRVLLVDDVCTEGSTLRVCADSAHRVNPDVSIVAAASGQMAVRQVVKDEGPLLSR